ncbi:MAG: helix-turn-helix domain-containing protein [Gemmatimonadaceae bacterium]
MEVVARLSPHLLAHLRVVLAREHTLIPVDGWAELAEAVRTWPVDVAVVDPRADGMSGTIELKALISRHPSLPIVLYTGLTPESLKSTVELAKHGVQTIVLRGFDDEPRRFRELLEGQPAYALSDVLMDRMSLPLGTLPPSLQGAIARLMRAPHTFRGVRDLATAAGMTRRSLDRWLDRAGLAPARTLLLGARLTRAYYYMRDPGYLIEDVTTKLGYASHRLFARQVRSATGLTPSQLRQSVEPEEFIVRLTSLMAAREGDTRAEARHGTR